MAPGRSEMGTKRVDWHWEWKTSGDWHWEAKKSEKHMLIGTGKRKKREENE